MLSERARPFGIVGRDESNGIRNIGGITPPHRNGTRANTVAMLQIQPAEPGFQQKYINPF